jgi:hypothetical protein
VIDYAIKIAPQFLDEDGEADLPLITELLQEWFDIDSWEYEEKYGKPVLEALEEEGLL